MERREVAAPGREVAAPTHRACVGVCRSLWGEPNGQRF